jgi:hypothetical protein
MNGMSKGLAIGMCICVFGAIILSELWGYHEIYSQSIIFGSVSGILIGTILEKQERDRTYAK